MEIGGFWGRWWVMGVKGGKRIFCEGGVSEEGERGEV